MRVLTDTKTVKRIRLPSSTRMNTKVHNKEVYLTSYDKAIGNSDVIIEGVTTSLDFKIEAHQFSTLIQEIDISSNNPFFIYEESDISWLVYCEPNRLKLRAPQLCEVIPVTIDNVRYNTVIETHGAYLRDSRHSEIPISLKILLN